MLEALKVLSGERKKVPTRAILLDVSHSTQHRQPQQPKLKHKPEHEEYIVCRAILSSFEEPVPSLDINSFLESMCEDGKQSPDSSLLVTIGNYTVKPWARWTNDPKTLAKEWYNRLRNGTAEERNVGNGTYYTPSLRLIREREVFHPVSIPSRLVIRCDGLAHDTPIMLIEAFDRLFQSVPLLIVDVEAFILAPPPHFDDVSASVAGIDIYKLIPNRFLSSFKATYLLSEDGTEEAENPHTYELAVSNQSGSRFSVAGVRFEMPAKDDERASMFSEILNILLKAEKNELEEITRQTMRDTLQNLHTLGSSCLTPVMLRHWLIELLRTWLSSHGYEAAWETVEYHLQKLVYKDQSEILLSAEGARIRGQHERQATFQEVNKFWERGNPVFGIYTYGAPVLLVPCDDLRLGLVLTMGPQMRKFMDDSKGILVCDGRHFMLFPSLSVTGLANDDYARMAIRRVVSGGLEAVGLGPAAYWTRRIEVVGVVAKLTMQYKLTVPDSRVTVYLQEILTKLLDKEQLIGNGQTGCSALTLLRSGQSLPLEHQNCRLLQPNPRQLLLFALGKNDGVPPEERWENLHLQYCTEKPTPGKWDSPSYVSWEEKLKEVPKISYPISLASLFGDTSIPQTPTTTEQLVITVPGSLSSGKSTAIELLKSALPEANFFCMTSEDVFLNRVPPSNDTRLLVLDHHPDLVTKPGIKFRPDLGSVCTNKDAAFIRHQKPHVVLVNTNATDATYLGLSQTPLEIPGTLRYRHTMSVEDWKDFFCFCVGNAEERTTGFRPMWGQRAKWFAVAKKKLALPTHIAAELVSIDHNTNSHEIQRRRQQHLDKGNDKETVKSRVLEFATLVTQRFFQSADAD